MRINEVRRVVDRAVARVVGAVVAGAKHAVVYVSPRFTVKATRVFRPRGDERSVEMVLTMGRPNYAERQFIKDYRKAGEKFPVRKIQVRGYEPRKG